MSDTLNFLREFKQIVKETQSIPDEVLAIIAERVEASLLSHSKEKVEALSDALSELWQEVLDKSPSSVIAAVLHKTCSPEMAAYTLGQLSFAQLLAAQVAEKRTHEDFIDQINSDLYRKYMAALLTHELTGKELASAVAETEESVSRKLKTLRELGITDYRIVGTSRRNFLTSTARAALAAGSSKNIPVDFSKEKNRFLENYKSTNLQPIMQNAQSFSAVAAIH